MSKIIDYSEVSEQNMSFCTSSPNMDNKPGKSKQKQKSKKRFFDVFHKKEIIYLNQDSISNSEESKFSNVHYKCIYCGNKYNNMNRFETHMKIHTGEKPYKCPFCYKIFTEKGNLKVHIRVHTNDRPYHCPFKDICKQSFKTKSQLSDHVLKHTKIKNYCCPECKASFSRKSRLKIHLMIHKGEKPFQCEICNKRFREKSNYNYHLKQHKKKLNKKVNKNNFEKKELIMDKNINNFCIVEDKKIHKLSEISNSTNSISNNDFEIINKLFEDENNESNKKNKAIFQILRQKNKSFNNINFPCFNSNENNFIINNNKEDDLKSFDEESLKYELNNNIYLNLDYISFPKNNNKINEEIEISKIKEEKEEEKNENNFEDLSIVNINEDYSYNNNALENNKINLTVFKNNFCQSYFPLNFEHIF